MKKLVKLKDVHLYVGFTDGVMDSHQAIKALKAAGINYTLLNYSDQEEHHKENFKALSTWALGEDRHQKNPTDYPILVWEEIFDDYSHYPRMAVGLQEILESDPFKYPELL